MTGQSEDAILAYHEALAIHPGESITTQLLKLALQDAVDMQTRPTTSMNHAMRFPALSEVAAEDLDRRVVEDEYRFFGKSLRIDESEEVDGARGGTDGKKKGRRGSRKGAGQSARTGARRGRQSTHMLQQDTTIDLESSQDMSLQPSSPATAAVTLPHTSTYGYGGTAARRSTRASATHSAYGTPHNASNANGTGGRERGESDFESQGENAEQDDDTERSYAGSDMVD